MGGDPQQQQGDLLNLGQSAIPSQLSGDTSGILGALPQQQQERQMMNTVTTPDAMQPQLPVNQEGGALGPLGPVPQQSQGMALFSPLHQFLLANSGQNPLLNNMAGLNMLMPNRFGGNS